ncbi:amino acid ABC transporter permease [Clostridium hydrogeniformans]|uniref:amino acid ABC transporter permease n=1 Tax=Clostridium hydrogeniformans TaxID=349933 RepID=UPI00048999FD|nr:amino acid ABC transporter permease [Clostridium hydrogeniformans]
MDFGFITEYYPYYLEGVKYTIILAFFTIALGIILGLALCLMKICNNKLVKGIATAYIEFIRGTPLLVQLLIIYYGLPAIGIKFDSISFLGSNFPDLIAAIITLSLNSAAYVAEIIRAGIEAVDKGQMEAARSLGMNKGMAMKYIIIPQGLKNILPALGNEFITIIKESSIVSVIGIKELMFNADIVRSTTFKPFEPLIVAAAIYFILTFSLSKLIAYFERRMKVSDSH